MSSDIYRYVFTSRIPLDDIKISLVLAIFAAESLYGQPQVRLDTRIFLDASTHRLVIDGTTDIGRDVNCLFLGFLSREHGEDSFRVERVDRVPPPPTSQEAAA